MIIPQRAAERAATTRIVMGRGGCHVSTYSTGSHGYAQVGWQDGAARWGTTAHRAAWVYFTGEQVPQGMTVDHTCKNRRCVRFDHLRLLSNYENARRTSGRDWPLGTCAHGHPNSDLRWVDGGRRLKCGTCHSEWQRRYREKHRRQAMPEPDDTQPLGDAEEHVEPGVMGDPDHGLPGGAEALPTDDAEREDDPVEGDETEDAAS